MTLTALTCLALNVYHEARGEPVYAQYAVARVTLNRAAKQRQPVCEVVYARHQFSWTSGRSAWPSEPDAWATARKVARRAIHMRDFTRGATHYHEKSVHPKWRDSMRFAGIWGNHVFYR